MPYRGPARRQWRRSAQAALDEAYDTLKSADDTPAPAPLPQGQKTLMSILFPGLSGAFGNTGVAANMGQTISPNETLIDFWKRSNS
jgi:hypothetical protein